MRRSQRKWRTTTKRMETGGKAAEEEGVSGVVLFAYWMKKKNETECLTQIIYFIATKLKYLTFPKSISMYSTYNLGPGCHREGHHIYYIYFLLFLYLPGDMLESVKLDPASVFGADPHRRRGQAVVLPSHHQRGECRRAVSSSPSS